VRRSGPGCIRPALLRITEPVTVEANGKTVAILPSDRFELRCHNFFDHPLVGHQSLEMEVTAETYARDIAPARTFGFEYELDQLRDMGLIRGLDVEGETARVRMTYTSMGCPCKEMIADDVRDALLALEGIKRVEVQEVFEPWTHRDLSRRAMRKLNELGVT